MKKTLYLGTKLPSFAVPAGWIHYPVIAVVPRSSIEAIHPFSFCVITSKHTIGFLLKYLNKELLLGKCISIGSATTASLVAEGIFPLKESLKATQEGVIEVLKTMPSGSIFYPRSQKARPVLKNYLEKSGRGYQVLDLYDTVRREQKPLPNLEAIDQIVFTSPSTVECFFSIFSFFPSHIKPLFQGLITAKAFADFNVVAHAKHHMRRPQG